jgi:N-acetylneuraminate synthase
MGVFVIAEAGVNHNGNAVLASGLVDAAAGAGADAVKFQTFRSETLASVHAGKASYQKQSGNPQESQQAMLKALELSAEEHVRLKARAQAAGIEFLSTPFDLESLSFLTGELALSTIKIGSGELTNAPLLAAAARTGRKIILSTGMGNVDEIADALGAVAFGYAGDAFGSGQPRFRVQLERNRAQLDGKVTLLQCTTAYPAPFADCNLRAIESLRDTFGLPVGLSDHSEGIAIAIAAVGCGAVMLEKHITLDRSLPGPDHFASLEPSEFKEMMKAIRNVEAALGNGIKQAMPSEIENMAVARKSLVALTPIRSGERFDESNLGIKRPGTGISPMEYFSWLGRTAARDYDADELIAQ